MGILIVPQHHQASNMVSTGQSVTLYVIKDILYIGVRFYRYNTSDKAFNSPHGRDCSMGIVQLLEGSPKHSSQLMKPHLASTSVHGGVHVPTCHKIVSGSYCCFIPVHT